MSAIRKSNRKLLKKGNDQKTKVIQLNVFKQPHQIETERFVNAIWQIAHASLWFNRDFTSKEKENFKALIHDHFYFSINHKHNFKDLIQRICLVKRYIARKRGRYISKPQDWLNIDFPLGLAGTSAWLNQVNEVRSDVPDYNKGITILANAILKYLEKPDYSTFQKFRKQLIAERQFDLLQIFNNTIINIQFEG